MANPFRFAAPVAGEQFTGRRAEVRDLVTRVEDHINVAVISPRRFGKTSLVNAVCARAERRGATVARLNAMAANDDLAIFASRLVSAVYAAKGPWRKAKDSLSSFVGAFRHFQPTVTIGTDGGAAFSFSAETVHQDPAAVIGDAYRLLATSSTPILFVDEFQEVVRLPGNIAGVFKALTDEVPQVALIVAGSKEHMMRDLTADSRGPLYGMTQVVTLGPIPADEMGDFVERRFNVGGKPITRELADEITALAGPVPNDIQHLAYDVYAAVESNREVTADDVAAGMQAAVEQESGAFIDTYAGLTGNQRMVLIALASAPTARPQSARFLARTGYANPSGVRRALDALAESGIVALRSGEWVVVNPFLRRWLAGQAG
jgi:hypothetical protein